MLYNCEGQILQYYFNKHSSWALKQKSVRRIQWRICLRVKWKDGRRGRRGPPKWS